MPSHPGVEDGAPSEFIVEAVREETHLLLGRTIGYSEEEWAQPSRLPGWTRSHVAAHLVQNAHDLLARARGPVRPRTAQSEAQRAHALELAALEGGLNLQIALDTSAGALHQALAHLTEPSDIPIIRLYEVVLHTFDLSPGEDDLHVAPEVANELLAFRIGRLAGADLPRLHVLSHEGLEARLGPEGEPLRVTGPAADLLVWLSRDVITDRVGGAVPLHPAP